MGLYIEGKNGVIAYLRDNRLWGYMEWACMDHIEILSSYAKVVYHLLPIGVWEVIFLIMFLILTVVWCGYLPLKICEVMEMSMSNKTYDTLKWIAMYLLPALGTLYFALSQIWGLPYGEQIVGTITAIDTFLAVILGISTANYIKGGESD